MLHHSLDSLKRLASVLALLLVLPDSAYAQSDSVRSVPAFDHIFLLVMENHAFGEVIGNTQDAPYINQIASEYGTAANYFAVAHPSLPNYLALAAGDTFGVTDDCLSCFVSGPSLVDRIGASGRTWRAYMEQLPGPCFLGDGGSYAQRHNPFIYFDGIRMTNQCGNIVPFGNLATDIASTATTPDYIWITPDVCHDMHDCSTRTGDDWLRAVVPQILNSPACTSQDCLFLITWDEDDHSQQNKVATLVLAKEVPAGFVSQTRYNHYSLVRTIEQAWELPPLTANDASATPMSDFFSHQDVGRSVQAKS